MLKLSFFECEGKSEFGRYSHSYTNGFHHGRFYPAGGGPSQLVYNEPTYERWIAGAEKAIKEHDNALRS